jgi:hypothetical protein
MHPALVFLIMTQEEINTIRKYEQIDVKYLNLLKTDYEKELYQERAAIIEFDGNIPDPHVAAARAFTEVENMRVKN